MIKIKTELNQIITFEEKDILEKDGVRIEVVPVWKWLLS